MADLNNVSAEALQEVLGWVKEAKELVADQAPSLAKEMVLFAIVDCIVGIVVAATVLYGVWRLCRYANKHWVKWGEEADLDLAGKQVFAIAIGGIATVFAFATGVPCLSILIKALVAPRLYVIEKLSSLLK